MRILNFRPGRVQDIKELCYISSFWDLGKPSFQINRLSNQQAHPPVKPRRSWTTTGIKPALNTLCGRKVGGSNTLDI